MKVAFQGERGAYSEEAVIRRFGGSAEPVPRPLLRDVFESVVKGYTDLGLIPVENTIEGAVGQSWDLLLEYPLLAEGEVALRVVHCLIANHGVALGEVRRVHSHPQALGQCRAFLERHGMEAVATSDTAGSVRMVREQGLVDAAAIGSCRAAEIYGMDVLARGIETHTENLTRFLVVGRGRPRATGFDKTSLAFSVEGNQARALAVFAGCGVDVLRLDSRPVVGRPWGYVVFVDVAGHVEDVAVGCAVRGLEGSSRLVRVLGSYPRTV